MTEKKTYFVAVTDSPAGEDLSIEKSVLADMRVEKVDWHDEASLIEAVHDADAIMCMHAPFNEAVIQSMQRLFEVSNPFDAFFHFMDYAYESLKKTYAISLDQYAETLFNYFLEETNLEWEEARSIILRDILIKPGRKVPRFLKDMNIPIPVISNQEIQRSLKRQMHHSTG